MHVTKVELRRELAPGSLVTWPRVTHLMINGQPSDLGANINEDSYAITVPDEGRKSVATVEGAFRQLPQSKKAVKSFELIGILVNTK
jgi:hypothetical protein